jgi:tRNA1Val (adenine37-N6)-methyltransferase
VGVTDFTDDGFLDGRVRVRQFRIGFRSGLDAAMLAAAVPARAGDTVLELGAGAGTASLCLAARVPGCTITAIEIDSDLVSLANENSAANNLEARVRFVQADVLNLPSELRTDFDHVLCNPPFHDEKSGTSPDKSRAQALYDSGDLSRWLEIGAKRTASNGTFTIVLRADRLNQALDSLPPLGIGVFPLWPKRGLAAKRVLVQLRQGARRPFALLPGLVLHETDGRYTVEADGVLRGRAALPISAV